jgi:hypothetical protein
MPNRTKAQREERENALASLRKLLTPGDTVYAIVRSVSRSGMSRTIDFYTFTDGTPSYLSGHISKALDYRRNDSGALKVGGAGMDLASHCVYHLGRALYPDGVPCTGEGCTSNDHHNGDCDYTPDGAIGGCMNEGVECTCHDESAWTPGAYPNGCSSCGCHRVYHVHPDGGYAFLSEIL